MKATVTFVDVRPDVKYQGIAYEYITILSLGDETFGTHDPDKRADNFDQGDMCIADLSLSVLSKVEKADRQWKGIRPNDETPEDYLNHTFCGKILSIDRSPPLEMIVDVGIGTAEFKPAHYAPQETVDSLSVGDFVTFTVSNTRLRGLEPA